VRTIAERVVGLQTKVEEVEKHTVVLDNTTSKLATSKVGKEDMDQLESKYLT